MALLGDIVTQVALALAAVVHAIQQPDQGVTNKVNKLNTEVEALKQQVGTLENSLQASAPNAAAAINSFLDLALANLYKLAVFVRGNFDERQVDESEKKILLDLVMSSFQDVQNKSEAALTILSQIHEKASLPDTLWIFAHADGPFTQSSELRSAKLIPLKGEIGVISQQTRIQLDGLGNSIKDASEGIAKLEEANRQTQANMNTLYDKEQAALASDVGVSWQTSRKLISQADLIPHELGIATFGI